MKIKELLAIQKYEIMKSRQKKQITDKNQERFMADMLSREIQHNEFLRQSKMLADRQYESIEKNTKILTCLLHKLHERGECE